MDPDCLLAGALAIDAGMGDVRVCVLLRGHHYPARPVHDWCPRRGGFLGHPGESQLEMSEGVGSVGPSSSGGWLFPCQMRLPCRHLPPVFQDQAVQAFSSELSKQPGLPAAWRPRGGTG